MKNELMNLKNENIEVKNRLKNIEEYIAYKKKEEQDKEQENYFFDLNKSHIITKKEEKEQLKKWISLNGNINNINLLYRATEDGDSCNSFFKKCGEKGPTLSLIKTNKNRRFGGFSKAEWTDKKGNVRLFDKNAFLFSLDDMKKYNILKKI